MGQSGFIDSAAFEMLSTDGGAENLHKRGSLNIRSKQERLMTDYRLPSQTPNTNMSPADFKRKKLLERSRAKLREVAKQRLVDSNADLVTSAASGCGSTFAPPASGNDFQVTGNDIRTRRKQARNRQKEIIDKNILG